MTRPIERIEQDIVVISEKTEAIALELQSAYTSYLTILGQAVRQQLILATYHLCTQGYPDKFLKLSLNQRQQLQQAIRQLAQNAAQQLLDPTSEGEENEAEEQEEETSSTPSTIPTPSSIPSVETPHLGVSTTLPSPISVNDIADQIAELVTPLSSAQDAPQTVTFTTNGKLPIGFLQLGEAEESTSVPTLGVSSNPKEVAKWQQSIERVTQQTLKKLSHEANQTLQKAGILPKKLPEQILEAAIAASEASADVVSGPPNILSLVIEVDREQPASNTGLTQIMAINLRLGEIEFANAKLSSERKQIRQILAQLNKIGQEYLKKHRELSIAEAEAAWRASWFEE